VVQIGRIAERRLELGLRYFHGFQPIGGLLLRDAEIAQCLCGRIVPTAQPWCLGHLDCLSRPLPFPSRPVTGRMRVWSLATGNSSYTVISREKGDRHA
jgi:hypothetical protein